MEWSPFPTHFYKIFQIISGDVPNFLCCLVLFSPQIHRIDPLLGVRPLNGIVRR